MSTFVRPAGLNTCTLVPQRCVEKNCTKKCEVLTLVHSKCVKHVYSRATAFLQNVQKCTVLSKKRENCNQLNATLCQILVLLHCSDLQKKIKKRMECQHLSISAASNACTLVPQHFCPKKKVQNVQFQKESLRCQKKLNSSSILGI